MDGATQEWLGSDALVEPARVVAAAAVNFAASFDPAYEVPGLVTGVEDGLAWSIAAGVPHTATNAVVPCPQRDGIADRVGPTVARFPADVPIAWHVDEGVGADVVACLTDAGFEPAATMPVLARHRDVPVGSGVVAFAGGVAGMYSMTVLPAARGRGIGSALVAWRLRAAHQRGARLAFLYSAGDAAPLWARAGLRSVAERRLLVRPAAPARPPTA